jgi:hypothetical protein
MFIESARHPRRMKTRMALHLLILPQDRVRMQIALLIKPLNTALQNPSIVQPGNL